MKTYNIFVFGIDNAGKSNLVNLIKGGSLDVEIKPTISFNLEKFIYENIEFQIWDAPGQKILRDIWLKGYERAKIMMFVIDNFDKSRFEEAKEEFNNVRSNPITNGIPIVFCIHKTDLNKGSIDIEEIKSFFLDESDKYRKIDWLLTSKYDFNSIYKLRKTLLDVVLARAKIAESYMNIIDGLSHDIKNQIMIIKNFAEFVSLKQIDSETREFMSFIKIAIEQTMVLLKKFKPNMNEEIKNQEFTDTQKVLQNSVLFISRGNNCQFKLDIQPNIPPIPIEIDKFTQIVNNILINATEAVAKKEKDGLILVSEKIVQITSDNLENYLKSKKSNLVYDEGNYLQIIIEDNGIGIPLKEQDNLFTLYYTSKSKGHGIGLATVHSLVNINGGFINFTSQFEQGTTFYIYLPTKPK